MNINGPKTMEELEQLLRKLTDAQRKTVAVFFGYLGHLRDDQAAMLNIALGTWNVHMSNAAHRCGFDDVPSFVRAIAPPMLNLPPTLATALAEIRGGGLMT